MIERENGSLASICCCSTLRLEGCLVVLNSQGFACLALWARWHLLTATTRSASKHAENQVLKMEIISPDKGR